MIELLNEKVSVVTVFDRNKGEVIPRRLKWNGRIYNITKLGFHHKKKQGTTLLHIFEVTDNNMSFRLKLDTDNLHWTLEGVSDGIAS